MTACAFKIGQMVYYGPTTRLASAASGPYQIIQRMATEDGEFKYRIKSPRAPHERVAMESDLRSVAPGDGEHVLIDFSDVIVRSLSAPSVQSFSSS